MIITRIIGGLGNQMFQYALGRSLALQSGQELKLDLSGFAKYPLRKFKLDNFALDVRIANEEEINGMRDGWLSKYDFPLKKRHIAETQFDFIPEIMSLRHGVYLDGYWQSELYFKQVETQIREDFQFRMPISDMNKKLAEDIQSGKSLSLHIRRGDYVEDEETRAVHGHCSLEYYNKAVDYMAEREENLCIYVFSDDHAWARENFVSKLPVVFVDANGRDTEIEDLRLMSMCKYHIIANSTFSWWGAWLSLAEHDNDKKVVIAPREWFAVMGSMKAAANACDLVPKEWVRL